MNARLVTAPDDASLQSLSAQLGERLRATRHMLVTAESCTGGWIAKAVTDVPGSSEWFDCGLAAYSYEAKQALLGVRPETLERFGAVSRETVLEMVSGALVHSGASLSVAVTGIAGPGGGTAEKPVGLVHMAAVRQGLPILHRVEVFGGDRGEVRLATVEEALLLALAALQPQD
jgi:nicotinamide-nucleotide amidase